MAMQARGLAAPAGPRADAPHAVDLLQSWLGLSTLQRRALEALIGEVGIASDHVEANVHGVSERFQTIAAATREQAATVRDLVAAIRSVRVEGRERALSEVASGLGDTLSRLTDGTRVATVMHALVEQDARVADLLRKTAETTQAIAAEVSAAVVGLQFQDLAEQRLRNVAGILRSLDGAIEALHDRTREAAGDPAADTPEQPWVEQPWVERMIAGCTLHEVRARLTNQMRPDRVVAAERGPDPAGRLDSAGEDMAGIDLF